MSRVDSVSVLLRTKKRCVKCRGTRGEKKIHTWCSSRFSSHCILCLSLSPTSRFAKKWWKTIIMAVRKHLANYFNTTFQRRRIGHIHVFTVEHNWLIMMNWYPKYELNNTRIFAILSLCLQSFQGSQGRAYLFNSVYVDWLVVSSLGISRCFFSSLKGECQYQCCRRTRSPHGSTRSGWYLLWMLQNTPGLEIRNYLLLSLLSIQFVALCEGTCLWIQSEV